MIHNKPHRVDALTWTVEESERSQITKPDEVRQSCPIIKLVIASYKGGKRTMYGPRISEECVSPYTKNKQKVWEW